MERMKEVSSKVNDQMKNQVTNFNNKEQNHIHCCVHSRVFVNVRDLKVDSRAG